MKRQLRLFITGLFIPMFAFADVQLAENSDFYYGQNVIERLSSENLKDDLHKVISSYHISQQGTFDRIVEHCHLDIDNCYTHTSLGYREARKQLFGYIDLQQDANGDYFVVSTYCQDEVDNSEFPKNSGLGPYKIPSANVLNTEHSWPQSHFSNGYSKSIQKSDLHALYPTRMKVNSTRGNYPFGEVNTVKEDSCPGVSLGYTKGGTLAFEPLDEVKGNIARSLFYFSTRYETRIDPEQEKTLREWHNLDPVDSDEMRRNEEIYKLQHLRNPYIDHPEWVEQISNF